MFRNKMYMVVAENEIEIYRLMKLAVNHHLHATYKIGIYGSERQHELFITGSPWNYHKFMNDIKRPAPRHTGNPKK